MQSLLYINIKLNEYKEHVMFPHSKNERKRNKEKENKEKKERKIMYMN